MWLRHFLLHFLELVTQKDRGRKDCLFSQTTMKVHINSENYRGLINHLEPQEAFFPIKLWKKSPMDVWRTYLGQICFPFSFVLFVQLLVTDHGFCDTRRHMSNIYSCKMQNVLGKIVPDDVKHFLFKVRRDVRSFPTVSNKLNLIVLSTRQPKRNKTQTKKQQKGFFGWLLLSIK